jgi:hypothetical protein
MRAVTPPLRRKRRSATGPGVDGEPGVVGDTASEGARAGEPPDEVIVLPRPANRSLAEAMARVADAGEEPLRAAFLARSLNALARLAPRLEAGALGEAVGRRSDYGVLLRALEEPGAVAALEEDDPLAEARLRGLEMQEQILRAEGGTLTVQKVARRLGITRQAVDKRRRAGRLLALPVGQHRYAYPAWQFGPEGILPGFEDAMADFFEIGVWTRAAFFLGGNTYLDGKRPLDELRLGNIAAVRRAASALGQHGAP